MTSCPEAIRSFYSKMSEFDIMQLAIAVCEFVPSKLQTWNHLRQAGHFSGLVWATQIYCSSKATTSNKEHGNLFFLLTKVVIQTENIMNDVGKLTALKLTSFSSRSFNFHCCSHGGHSLRILINRRFTWNTKIFLFAFLRIGL